jgi:hypothetical protein
VALPAVAITWTALLWEPGQKVLANGFASFWLGVVASGAALLLGLESRRQPAWVHLAAVAGLLLLVAQTWTPLVILAGPAMLLVLVFDSEQEVSATARWLPRAVVLVAAVAAVVKVVVLLAGSVPLAFLVGEVSGFDGTSPLPTFVLLVVGLLALTRRRVWARGRTDGTLSQAVRARLAILLLVPVLGFLSLAAFLAMQIHVLGTTSYYFLKYLVGFELVLACVVPAVCAMLLPTGAFLRWSPRRTLVTTGLVAALGTQLFAPATQSYTQLFSEDDDGTAAIAPPYTRDGIARGVLAAVHRVGPRESLSTEYLPLGRGNAVQIFYPDAWFHAVNATVTNGVMQRMGVLRVRADGPERATVLAQRLLEAEDDLTILVPVPHYGQVRARINDPDLARRVVPLP